MSLLLQRAKRRQLLKRARPAPSQRFPRLRSLNILRVCLARQHARFGSGIAVANDVSRVSRRSGPRPSGAWPFGPSTFGT